MARRRDVTRDDRRWIETKRLKCLEGDYISRYGQRNVPIGRVDRVVTQFHTIIEIFHVREITSTDIVWIVGIWEDANIIKISLGVSLEWKSMRAARMGTFAFRLFVNTLGSIHLRMNVKVSKAPLGMTVEVLLVATEKADVVVNVVIRRSVVVVQTTTVC